MIYNHQKKKGNIAVLRKMYMKKGKQKSRILILLFFSIIIACGIIISIKYMKKEIYETKNDDIKTNMLILQGKVKIIKGKSEVDKNNDSYIGKNISNLGDETLMEFLKSLKIEENDLQNYYLIEKSEIEQMGLQEEIKYIDKYSYIVNYENAEVIFKEGIQLNNELKYKLSDILPKKQKPNWILYKRIGVDK